MPLHTELRPVAERAPARSAYPCEQSALPPGVLRAGRYDLRFASGAGDLRTVQRLRFEVFNLELGEGLASAYDSGRDEDEFDSACHHLMVIDRERREVVGTYRLMTATMAKSHGGFYSAEEYDLSALPDHVAARGVEIGRACVAPAHRSGRVILLLWRGLARYLDWNQKRYLFGCCSIPTVDPATAARARSTLHALGQMHPTILLPALPPLGCTVDDGGAGSDDAVLPPLFQGYLKLGARVASEPAIDRAFGVTDFFVLLDREALEPGVFQGMLGRTGWDAAL